MVGADTHLHMWRPGSLPGITLFRADRIRQQFARHTHDEYAIGVITSGVLGFDYLGASHLAGAGEINIVVPGEAHTGQPELGESWSYRMFYIEPAVLRNIARQAGLGSGSLPFFRAGVLQDRPLAAAIQRLHNDLHERSTSALEAESRVTALLAAWIRRHAEKNRAAKPLSTHAADVSRVREFLETCWHRKPTLNELADLARLSPYQLLRAFVRQYGLPPHAYLIQRQVREAKRLIEEGVPIAEVACSAGFADQSHLNRHFKRAWGLTPGQFRNFVQEGSGRRR